jgi:hypothetical protein
LGSGAAGWTIAICNFSGTSPLFPSVQSLLFARPHRYAALTRLGGITNEGEGVAGAASFCEPCSLRLGRLRWAKRDASRITGAFLSTYADTPIRFFCGIEKKVHSPCSNIRTSSGLAALKSFSMRTFPLQAPSVRFFPVPPYATSRATGLPAFASTISSPAAASSTSRDRWVLAAWVFSTFTWN